ncbi:MAG: hypothetical protein JXQ83_15125 [Candidatus Glassbacteria bacterium]|nr:hypothetical protein [Candidatus Glassbacteria bacterium]
MEFSRKEVDVHRVFGDALVRHLVDGKVADKQKLEQDKLKISARLVNFVAAGGVLFFSESGEESGLHHEERGGDGDLKLDETALFRLLEKTSLVMLNQLNQPEVNLLKISLNKSFRARLQEIFISGASEAPDHFPIKIFRDLHPEKGSFIGINMRNTRSLGEDLSRIERDRGLRQDIAGHRRPFRHGDGDLARMFSPPTDDKT